jgi:hypothetical protein
MKEAKFDRNQQRWDQYKAFYIADYGDSFVRFDTGEAILARAHLFGSPNTRRSYPEFGVDLLYAHEWDRIGKDRGHLWDPHNNRKVFKSWIGSSLSLLYDHDTHRVVHPTTTNTPIHPGIPTRFAGLAYVYWAGPGHEPVTAGKISYHPFVDIPLEEKREIRERLTLIKTQVKLLGGQPQHQSRYQSPSKEEFLRADLTTWSLETKASVVAYGLSSERPMVTVPWLELRV